MSAARRCGRVWSRSIQRRQRYHQRDHEDQRRRCRAARTDVRFDRVMGARISCLSGSVSSSAFILPSDGECRSGSSIGQTQLRGVIGALGMFTV
jgi:hypothetical protein